MSVLQLKYSGPQAAAETGDECIKTEVADVGLSESTCGNGNSDLYNALIALINGQPLPTASSSSTFGATVWVQDMVGNGYEAVIAKGTMTRESQVTVSPTELFNISPAKIVDGFYDFESDTGWVIDRIWSASWAGSVTDVNGVSTAKPGLTIDGAKIKLTPAGGVYGCLKIRYDLTRDKFYVENDGDGETEGDPYSTSITFDVDGCDDEVVLALAALRCRSENLRNFLGLLADGYGDGDGDVGVEINYPPPTEDPQDTERSYRYCDKKFISAFPRSAGEGYEGTCLGTVCGSCGDDDDN